MPSPRRSVLVALALWWAGALGAQDVPPAPDTIVWRPEIAIDRVVAVVGPTPILWSDVLFGIGGRLRGQRPPSDPAEQRRLAEEMLNQLVNEEVLVQKARGDTTLKVTDADVNAQVDQAFKRVRDQFRTEGEFRDALRREAFANPDDYRKKLADDARRQEFQQRLIQKLKQDGRLSPLAVSEAEIAEGFARARAQLPRKPPTVAFRQLAVAPRPTEAARQKALAKILALYAQLQAGGDFETIAKRESQDEGSREVGGDLGWNRRGRMVPEFDNVMFRMLPGVVSQPVETTFGYHLIRVDRVQPAEVKARHILIQPAIDSADVALARLRADTAAALWRAGTPFDSLVARFHDASEDRGSIEPFDRTQLPERYQRALEGKGKGDIVGPFEVPDRRGVSKHFVLQVVSASDGGEYTLDEIKDRLREQRGQEKALERLLEGLKKEIHVTLLLGPTLPTPLTF